MSNIFRIIIECSVVLYGQVVMRRLLLQHLVGVFAPSGVLVMGIDDTIERRWGKRIMARGIYRDPVRLSDSHFVKTSGVRWRSSDATGRHSLGTPSLGTPVFHRFGTLRAASSIS